MKTKDDPFSSNGTQFGYDVEGRLQGDRPGLVAGQMLDGRWRRITFERGPVGVPVSPYFGGILEHAGLYPFAAAQALRWWFHAEAERAHTGFSLETRLVPHKVSHRIEWYADGEPEHIEGTWPERLTDSASGSAPNE